MSANFSVKNFGHGKFRIFDVGGPSGGNVLTTLDVGDLKVTFPTHGVDRVNANADIWGDVTYIKRRGRFTGEVRFVEEQPITGSFTVHLENFTGGGDPADITEMDIAFANPSGPTVVDGWTFTNGSSAEVPLFDADFTMEGTALGETKDHTLTFRRWHITSIEPSEGAEKNVMTISWACIGGVARG